MARDNKFPVKYAVLELKEKGGYITDYEDIIRGYIVSKCWVVESSIKYFSDGNSKVFHKVVFPYKDLDTLKKSLSSDREDIGKRVTVDYDFNFNPFPIDVVSELFDTYEDAKQIADEKNSEMQNNIASKIYFSILDPRFKQALSDCEQEFAEQLSICQLFEKLALLESEDMTITDSIDDDKGLQLLKRL